MRFILNLKKLNQFISAPHFKLEDSRSVLKLITNKCYFAKLDIKDAYFLVPVSKNYRKFLRFEFDNQIYEFNCLPFGLNIAPYVYTKLLKPVLKQLRINNVFCVSYLDDLLIIGKSYPECYKSLSNSVELLTSLGFIINKEKSNLIPAQKIEFLGFCFNSLNMSISLPLHKKQSIVEMLKHFQKLSSCKIREFSKILGKLVAASPAVKYGWLHTKQLEKQKFVALKNNNNNYDKTMLIDPCIKQEISWWIKSIGGSNRDIKTKPYSVEIFSDASRTGWGGFCGGSGTHGFWSKEERRYHINVLELLAAYYALKTFARNLTNSNILLRIDNVTAISCINKMGSVQFKNLHDISKKIWGWCEKRQNIVFASYVSSSQNIEADFQSRTKSTATEYELSQKAFDLIINKLGKPDIDLFASNLNKKCKQYVSWKPDPNSIAVDAFTLSWRNIYFYAFPPFAIITTVLEKIVEDQATGIVVVPLWPSQPWYPLFESLTCEKIILKPGKHLLLNPFREPHPLRKSLILVAARLSGKHS